MSDTTNTQSPGPAASELAPARGSVFVRMFKPQFAPLVESGAKCQTVRPLPKRMPKAGDRISLREWTGRPYRSKQRVLLECTLCKVSRIHIASEGWVWLNDIRIKTRREFEAFARADGFDTPELMLRWFRDTHGLPFDGMVLYWPNPEVSQARKRLGSNETVG